MRRLTWLVGIAVAALAASLTTPSHGSDTLPLRPVPFSSGTVTTLIGPGSWATKGAWIDEQTVASAFSNFGILVIHRTDGTILQTFPNPDSTSRDTAGYWDAPVFVGDALLIKSKGIAGQQWQHVHIYSRSSIDGSFSFAATVVLTGVPIDVSNSTNSPMWVESITGGVQSRRIVVAWNVQGTGNVRVFVPTGSDFAYSVQSLQYTPTVPGSTPRASVRGNLMVVRPTTSDDKLRFFRQSGNTWASEGSTWDMGTGILQMSDPVVLSNSQVFVGEPNFNLVGRVHELRKVGSSWTSVSTLAPHTATTYSPWGAALCVKDDWLFIARKTSSPEVATVESFLRAADGSLIRGATYEGPANTTAYSYVEVTANGMLTLNVNGGAGAWNWAQVGSALDLDNDGVNDCVAINAGSVNDCNHNGVPDSADIALGLEADANLDGVPDACTADCDSDGTTDYGALLAGAPDCNGNFVPDACDLAQPGSDVNRDGNLDACDPDCNLNGIPDSVELQMGALEDCDGNGIADTCDRYQPIAPAGANITVNSQQGGYLWFAVDPSHPVVCGIDMQHTQSNPSLTVTLGIIKDPTGAALASAVTANQVLFFETLSPTVHDPVEAQGGMTINRYRFAPVDLTGAGGFWVMFSKSVKHVNMPVPTTTAMSGHHRLISSPSTWSAASISQNLAASVHYPDHVIEAWPLALSCGGAADLNYDGVVDGADLGMLLGSWGGTWSAADLDHNGIIDGGDLGAMLGSWGAP